jgi:hypothetical protein
MRYVILRDDDTNALTPVDYLERLYRPFLDRGLPVNLATIPNVRTDITYGDGIPEGFLVARNGASAKFMPIGAQPKLVRYLLDNPGYHIVQHGYSHEFIRGDCEFEQEDRREVIDRLEKGAALLKEAGFPDSETFVAPYDRFTSISMEEVAKRFRLISTSWFEWGRLPRSWWPALALKKLSRQPHWQVGSTILLSHPGCHLSYHRSYDSILDTIHSSIQSRRLTVLVTHWWEFFRENQPDKAFIEVLHQTADYLANASDVKVVSFDDVAAGRIPLN